MICTTKEMHQRCPQLCCHETNRAINRENLPETARAPGLDAVTQSSRLPTLRGRARLGCEARKGITCHKKKEIMLIMIPGVTANNVSQRASLKGAKCRSTAVRVKTALHTDRRKTLRISFQIQYKYWPPNQRSSDS